MQIRLNKCMNYITFKYGQWFTFQLAFVFPWHYSFLHKWIMYLWMYDSMFFFSELKFHKKKFCLNSKLKKELFKIHLSFPCKHFQMSHSCERSKNRNLSIYWSFYNIPKCLDMFLVRLQIAGYKSDDIHPIEMAHWQVNILFYYQIVQFFSLSINMWKSHQCKIAFNR